ncbi:MAG: hypothetical protein PUE96_02040, partial [Oscillospiraceae bacterium]|nr:hypothetical protein [Oscillospiraceae bacterium]
MAKKIQKVLALLMTLSLCISLLSVTALADGVEEEHAGTKEDPNVTITVTPSVKDEETGNTSQTTTTEKDWKEDNTDPNTGVGTKIEGSETKEQTIVTDEDGNQIGDYGTVNGSEKTTTVTKSD